MLKVARSHSRRLPWDVLLVVFQECDDATLALLGRVSLDFLQSTASILYEHLEVNSEEALKLLFCERTSLKMQAKSFIPSRINPFLSLAQTKTLRVDLSNLIRTNLDDLSFSRIALPLDLLHLSTRQDEDVYISVLCVLHSTLLPHLNPTRLEYLDHTEEKDTPYQPLYTAPLLQHWTRLEVIDLQGTFPYRVHSPVRSLAALPSLSLAQGRTLRLHVATLLAALFTSPSILIPYIVRDREFQRFGLDVMQEGSVVLVVRSEEEEENVKQVVQTLAQRWRSLFTVKLEV